MTLSYLQETPRRTWRDVLGTVVIKGNVTAKDVAKILGLSHPDACIRLKRLKDWGMVRITDSDGTGSRVFEATDYGTKVHVNPKHPGGPTSKPEEEEETTPEFVDLGAIYPDLDAIGGVIEGPVALQRLVEIDDITQATKRVPPEKLAVEKKFDGWLVQVAGGRIYSRRGMELTLNFPQIYAAVKDFTGEHFVGELVYWTPAGKMNEPTVTKVAMTADPREAMMKTKALPGYFQYVLFDMIGFEGEDISKESFGNRRLDLKKIVRTSRHLAISPLYTFARWHDVYNEALAEGGEGVVLKNIEAPYFWRPLGEREPKPTGVQFKLKAVRTDDFVVTSAYVTEKESLIARFGQFWHGEYVEVGEVNNFSADVEREIVERLKKGPFVMELAFQERFEKPPGRLRNPRFVRFRDDKPIESVTLPQQFAP